MATLLPGQLASMSPADVILPPKSPARLTKFEFCAKAIHPLCVFLIGKFFLSLHNISIL